MNQAVIDAKKHSNNKVLAGNDAVKPYIYILALASMFIITGFIWDISWHQSFGRDRFLAPPHIFIYIGAIVCGTLSGFQVLKRSFWGTTAERQASVKFWWVFYGPLGGLLCIWGALAMLTSAPFDDWWHKTFGLDTKILSPPHTLLLAGMVCIQLGAYISVVASGAGKTFDKKHSTIHNWVFALAAGSLLATIFTLFTESLEASLMHSWGFYVTASLVFPIYLFAASRASRTKWGATAASGVFMFELAAMIWILEQFPAKPLLGPILNHFDHYQPFRFPLLLIFPALAIDIILNKYQEKAVWIKVVFASLAFLLILFVVQWNFGTFYHTSVYSRNGFFASYALNYATNPDGPYRYAFNPRYVSTGIHLAKGLAVAAVAAIASGWVGYIWGGWIKSVQR